MAEKLNYIWNREWDRGFIETKAFIFFGEMREATAEEKESIDDYVKSISKKIGDMNYD